MKELETKHRIGIHEEAKQRQEYKFIGRMQIPKGCKLFSCDPKTGKVYQVKMERKFGATLPATKRINFYEPPRPDQVEANFRAEYDSNRWYVVAINAKNATKKFLRYAMEINNDNK